MRIPMDDYAYVLVKLSARKARAITQVDPDDLAGIESVGDLHALLQTYLPRLALEEVGDPLQLEHRLVESFILQVAQLIEASPARWRLVLEALLLEFEVKNLKNLILGIMAGLPRRALKRLLYDHVARVLGHEEWQRALVNQQNMDDILYLMKRSIYLKPVREGIVHYRRHDELFQLQAYLDRFYYQYLASVEPPLDPECTRLWTEYLNAEVELYNLDVLFRGITNKIDRKLVRELLIPREFLLSTRDMAQLLQASAAGIFLAELEKILADSSLELLDTSMALRGEPDVTPREGANLSLILGPLYVEELQGRLSHVFSQRARAFSQLLEFIKFTRVAMARIVEKGVALFYGDKFTPIAVSNLPN